MTVGHRVALTIRRPAAPPPKMSAGSCRRDRHGRREGRAVRLMIAGQRVFDSVMETAVRLESEIHVDELRPHRLENSAPAQ